MEYKTIYNIFNLMQETQKALDDIGDLRTNLKKQGRLTEAENLFDAEKRIMAVLSSYRDIIINYVNSAECIVDDFDEEFEEFLKDNIYDLKDYYENDCSNDAINDAKEEARRDFIATIWASVIEENFYNRDETIQAFINSFSQIDLYLYITDRYLSMISKFHIREGKG